MQQNPLRDYNITVTTWVRAHSEAGARAIAQAKLLELQQDSDAEDAPVRFISEANLEALFGKDGLDEVGDWDELNAV